MFHGNVEPTVSELLGDPIGRLIMARDGLRAETVWDFMHDAKRRLRSVPPLAAHSRPGRALGRTERRCGNMTPVGRA
jgi:hypothetical protein